MASFLRSLHRHLSLTDRFRRGDRTHRDEAGFSLIEAVISVALLALIVVPITHLVVTTEGSANSLHLRAEASDLATQALETAQYQTANGVNPTAGITTTTQHAGTDPFTVAVDWELAAGTGAASTVCIAPPGQLSSRIWTVKVTVSWGNTAQEGQKAHVVATTLVSPTVADLADTNAAEIAVPVYNSDDSTLETTQPITITVTGSCAQGAGMCGTVPSNESTAETANTGSSGCAVFPDLFAGAGETYNITATPPSPYVDPNEVFYTPASGVQIWSAVPVQANQVTVANNPNLILAPGATMSVKFQTVNFGTVTPPTLDTSVNPAPYLPISVESSTLLCSGIGTNTCVLGNPSGTGTNSFSSSASQPAQTALLYPGPLVTNPQISVSTTSGSASVTVASGGFPGVTVGMPVTGTGIAAGTIVSMISGNTLTLSANATATGTATLTFVAPNYSAWAGDQANSAPSYNSDYMYDNALSPTSRRASRTWVRRRTGRSHCRSIR